MRPIRLVPLLLTLSALVGTALGQAAAPEKAQNAAGKAAAKKPTTEQLRLVLQDAYKAVMALEKKEEWNNLEESKAKTLRVIGAGQARVGDVDAARKAWQDALDLASAIDTSNEKDGKAWLIAKIAEAQAEAGDHEGALATLQQATQACRLIRDEGVRPLFFIGDSTTNGRAETLQLIASVQKKAGEAVAARKTFEQAVDAASSLGRSIDRIRTLVQIARAEDSSGGKEIWLRTAQTALTLKDEGEKAGAIELVVRALTEMGRGDEAIRLVNERLEGDLNAFALAVIAGELLLSETAAAPRVVQSLRDSAERAHYDQTSKRATVFTQLAVLLARAGDLDGAYKAIEAVDPKNAPHRTNALFERASVMKEVARSHLEAGRKDEAKEVVRTVLEKIVPFQGENGEVSFPIQELMGVLARAGGPADAMELAAKTKSRESRIEALLAIARVQAELGDREAARKTLDDAIRAADGIPKATLWTGLAMEADQRWKPTRLREGARAAMGMRFENAREHKYGSLVEIAVAYADVGDAARAIEVANSISSEASWNGSEYAFARIAAIQAKAGDFEAALKTAGMLQDSDFGMSEKSEVLQTIARAQVKAGRVRDALEAAGTTNSPKTKLDVWRALAESIAPTSPAEPAKPH